MNPINEMISSVPADAKEIDIVLVTPGGSANQVNSFVNVLRPRFEKVNFIVLNMAMSAGTIFIMSGDEIIMSANVSISANYSLIQSIVGIGQINAATIIVMTENFTKFDNPRKFACYCGVAPFEYTSGTSIRGKTRTSKLAAKDLKALLTRAAITAMVHDPQIKSYYARKVAEGKHKASVINAIRAKIIYRCFAVVKRQTPYVKLMA